MRRDPLGAGKHRRMSLRARAINSTPLITVVKTVRLQKLPSTARSRIRQASPQASKVALRRRMSSPKPVERLRSFWAARYRSHSSSSSERGPVDLAGEALAGEAFLDLGSLWRGRFT